MFIPDDALWCFSTGDYYEKNVIHWFEKIIQLKKEPVVYEIGSNYGYYVLRFEGQCKMFYAFEPVASTFKVLDENIKRNRLKNSIAINKGMSDKERKAEIYTYSSSLNNSLFRRSIPTGHSLKEKGTEQITLSTLDRTIERDKFLMPGIIKIDTEGAELEVLKGARRSIELVKPIILFEYSDSTAADADYRKEEIIEFLKPFGYIFFGLSEDQNSLNLISEENFHKEPVANILALQQGMKMLL